MTSLVSKTSSQVFFQRILKVITQTLDFVYQTMKSEIDNTNTVELNHSKLSSLSVTLNFDTLWDTLSEFLKELDFGQSRRTRIDIDCKSVLLRVCDQ